MLQVCFNHVNYFGNYYGNFYRNYYGNFYGNFYYKEKKNIKFTLISFFMFTLNMIKNINTKFLVFII